MEMVRATTSSTFLRHVLPNVLAPILALCINMFGDAVRDYLDPRLRTATNP